MQFFAGSAVFLSSLFLLAVLARIASADPESALLRGDYAPGFFSVLITGGFSVGLLMMAFGGRGLFASPVLEGLAIVGFALVSIWLVVKLVGRRADGSAG